MKRPRSPRHPHTMVESHCLIQGYAAQRTQSQSPGAACHRSVHGRNNEDIPAQSPEAVVPKQIPLDQGDGMDLSIIHYDNDDDSESDGCFQDANELDLMLDGCDTQKQQEGDQGLTNEEDSRRRARHLCNYDNDTIMEGSEAILQVECFRDKEKTDVVGATTDDLSVQAFLQPRPLEITNSDSWKTVVEHVKKGLRVVLDNLNDSDGIQKYLDWRETHRHSHSADREASAREAELAQLEAKIHGDPRTYQRQLLERAKQGNVIVHLGTGYGKTLIALLLIKHVHRNQIGVTAKTIFLVPSVALALQHTTTLRANLPYTVATACYETSNNTVAYPRQLADADILVATQGALWDLLLHYQDLVSLDRYALLVVDECHYCAGSHAYRLIFQKFYHTLPEGDRPHVLGLTASPIINLRESHSEEELDMMVQTLQDTMDAVLISVDQEDDFVAHSQCISEEAVHYQGFGVARALPSADNLFLHPSRYRELRQLEVLYLQVGPLVVSLYCKALLHELSRNEFEEESPAQFETVLCHLRSVTQWCEQESHTMGSEGRADKLLALESILERELITNPTEAVGLVFCHRRITAVALHNYFRWREENKDHLGKHYGWGKSGERRRQSHQNCNIQRMGCTLDDEDPFADAWDDPLSAYGNNSPRIVSEKDRRMDAEFDMEKFYRIYDSGHLTGVAAPWMETHIKSTFLVRDVTSIFTSLSADQSQAADECKQNWLHIDHRVQDVLSKLRRQELNLLFATSVVEEGVDVQACSVVVAFDSIRSTKSYVQMKGRARRRKAKFFVFQDSTGPSGKATVSLESARNMEARLRTFIACKARVGLGSGDGGSDVNNSNDCRHQLTLEPELSAARQGFYQGSHGTVDLQSAKGLLTRYCLSVPLDPHVRLSREAFMAHMPDFRENGLVLPSHLPSSIRVIVLPVEFLDQSKRDKQKVLSLMACVRLHCHRLLNERLLPLSQMDIQHHILRATNPEFSAIQKMSLPLDLFFESYGSSRLVFVRTISYRGEIFLHTQQQIRGEGHQLALITVSDSTCELPVFSMDHKEFGSVEIQYSTSFPAMCDEHHFEILLEFFILLLDERWRRSRKHSNFNICNKEEYSALFMPYVVGLVGSDGKLDWDFMKEILIESHRTDGEREAVVRCLPTTEALGTPRLWTSTIDGHTTYIAYGPAHETVSTPFPVEMEGVYTYTDYFEMVRGTVIASDVQLFDVQRYWSLPSSFSSLSVSAPGHEPVIKAEDSRYAMSEQLSAVKIPQTVAQEARIANAHVGLLSCFLPQVLFVYERFERTRAFVESCCFNLPKLGSYLARLPLETVAAAITCKSCGMDVSYEKLEWFGDAVLKMIQTESLLKSIELKDWIQVLHEGDLSMLRQEMGSNNRLEGICKHFELGRFVMSENLARGLWLPALLDVCNDLRVEQKNSTKIYADVMESILGLVYVEFGYDAALAVGDELQFTVPWQERSGADAIELAYRNVQLWDSLVSRTTGYESIRSSNLFAEAFSHASGGYPNVPSYERLEWTGDAVLCLAIRQWIWYYFPDADLRKMVILEGAIISNEVLAFVAVKTGLHHYLQHNDHTLPSRIESYICSVQEDGRGLWSTDPPKVIADIVESLIGAIYVDGGLEAGMKAARTLLKPVLDVILIHGEHIDLVHPKKKLQELVGELLVVETTWEDNFYQNTPLLDGSQLRFADAYGTQGIGYVRFMDTILVAVSDSSRAVARNKACAIIVQVLTSDLNLLQGLQSLRYLVESTATPRSSDT